VVSHWNHTQAKIPPRAFGRIFPFLIRHWINLPTAQKSPDHFRRIVRSPPEPSPAPSQGLAERRGELIAALKELHERRPTPHQRKLVTGVRSPTSVIAHIGAIPRALWHTVCLSSSEVTTPVPADSYVRPSKARLTAAKRWHTRWRCRPPRGPHPARREPPTYLPNRRSRRQRARPQVVIFTEPPLPIVAAALELISHQHSGCSRARKRACCTPPCKSARPFQERHTPKNTHDRLTSRKEWRDLLYLSYAYHSKRERWRTPHPGALIHMPNMYRSVIPTQSPKHPNRRNAGRSSDQSEIHPVPTN
jgi:hypothetical protein